MECETLALIFGSTLLIIGTYGTIISWRYYVSLEPPTDKFALRVMVAFILFGIFGGFTSIGSAFFEGLWWPFIALFMMLGFLILALSSLYYLKVLYEEFGSKIYEREEIELVPAGGFIVENLEGVKTLLRYLFSRSGSLFVISRRPQNEWEKEFGIKPAKYLWLSRVEAWNSVSPSNLHVILEEAVRFMRTRRNSIIYIEGIEYLILYNDFKSVAKFLFTLRDYAIVEKSLLLIFVSPDVLEKPHYSILKREFETLDPETFLEEVLGTTLFGAVTKEDFERITSEKPLNEKEDKEEYASSESSEA
ncbi:DUF835 domain-containing protein [Thermococcus sp. M39]|uniref:DUF835 domain-containing protein n=1 Tax=Thermococcus sp. M39 TaxID=1638262 RepID=UPI001439D9D0|nr:DUF835 domain-containing protein [Thermococcus sp. M39]NJE07817.1 DUF835 domain-containing protein [Thermococcus sp. M39]